MDDDNILDLPTGTLDKEYQDVQRELQQDEPDAPEMSEADIAAKYDSGQAHIVIQRNDFLVPNILTMVRNRQILDVAPIYQRRLRWTPKKQSQLIESLLMNVPIPPIFLYETDYARYEVMDGQQRLTAIHAFFANEYALSGLTEWPELNGRRFRDLPSRIQSGLQRRGLAAVIILSESTDDPDSAMRLRQYVFERLNTGGQPLNAQEVRNCINAGEFNQMLVRVSRSRLFTEAWDIPPKEPDEPAKVSSRLQRNPMYASMSDCEIVLRYFALLDMALFSGGMKRTLDSCMRRLARSTQAQCSEMEARYLDALRLATVIYGDQLFRLPPRGRTRFGRRSVPLSDAVLLGITAHLDQADKLVSQAQTIRTMTEATLKNPTTYEALVGKANTKESIENRLAILRAIVGAAAAGSEVAQ